MKGSRKFQHPTRGISAGARLASGGPGDQMEAWVSEIKARAWVRIGELSAAMPTGGPGGKGKSKLPSTGKLKHEALKAAGISQRSRECGVAREGEPQGVTEAFP
jgi:hypothetical protein